MRTAFPPIDPPSSAGSGSGIRGLLVAQRYKHPQRWFLATAMMEPSPLGSMEHLLVAKERGVHRYRKADHRYSHRWSCPSACSAAPVCVGRTDGLRHLPLQHRSRIPMSTATAQMWDFRRHHLSGTSFSSLASRLRSPPSRRSTDSD